MMKVGDTVETLYGRGILLGYKETSNVYIVDLPFGKLFANKESIRSPGAVSNKVRKTMEINDAYESLEIMRRLNLEVTCQELGIAPGDSSHHRCVLCLMAEASTGEEGTKDGQFPRVRRKIKSKKARKRCLICGSPVCPSHASKVFRAERINICMNCELLFRVEFVVDCLTVDKSERQQLVDQMIDLYDRTALLLKYSSQYIDKVAGILEKTEARQNKVGAGGSSAGMVSGALGIAAAATILTPAGPPLLIASLLFGGSATAIHTGTEIRNRYFSEPHQLAGNIITLHNMLKSILKVADTLREAVARDMVVTECLIENKPAASLIQKVFGAYGRNQRGVMANMAASRLGMAGMEVGQLAKVTEKRTTGARNVRFLSARFARCAGGAISGATLLFESKFLHGTVKSIRDGNPCDKAKTLRKIQEELHSLPLTADLDRECENYLEAMGKRKRCMTEEQAVRLLIETTQEQVEVVRQAENGFLTVKGEDAASQSQTRRRRKRISKSFRSFSKTKASTGSAPRIGSRSLLKRTKKFKVEQETSDFEVEGISFDEPPVDLLD